MIKWRLSTFEMSRSLFIFEWAQIDWCWWWLVMVFDVRLLFVHCECWLFIVSNSSFRFIRNQTIWAFGVWRLVHVKIWPTIKFDVLFQFFPFSGSIHRLFSRIAIMILFEIWIEKKKAKRDEVVEKRRRQNVNNNLINVFSSSIVEFWYDSSRLL